MRLVTLLAAVALVVPSLVACIIDTGSSNNNRNPPPGPTATATGPSKPLVVVVETNQTLSAAGGDGVGVFVEYRAGGHWKVWDTCDTNKSGASCDFDLVISAAQQPVSNAVSLQSGAATTLAPGANGSLEATSSITTQVSGLTFDTAPGDTITVDATVSGIHSGDYFFFVERLADGSYKVNGGFGGNLTNPLSFQPSAP